MLMTEAVVNANIQPSAGVRFEYTYTRATSNRNSNPRGGWYISPRTPHRWNWGSAAVVTGVWRSSRGNFGCRGSSERGAFGITCSNGGGRQLKVNPEPDHNPGMGRCKICQDRPDAFRVGACTPSNGVEVWWRPAHLDGF